MSIALKRSRQVPADETPAFGGIAERFRRAGDLERAVALCQDGLKKFPDHLSARVTLGWSLLDLGRYDEAQVALEQVLKRAPDNLAAIRGLAELHERAENAVIVPDDDQEVAEVAQALESANRAGVAETLPTAQLAAEIPTAQLASEIPTAQLASEAPTAEQASTEPKITTFAEAARAHEPPAAPATAAAIPSLEDLSREFAAPAPPAAPVVLPPVEIVPNYAAAAPAEEDLAALIQQVAPASAPQPEPSSVIEAAPAMAEDFVQAFEADAAVTAAEQSLQLALAAAEAQSTAEAHPHPEVTDTTHAGSVADLLEPAHAATLAPGAEGPASHPQPEVAELLAQLSQDAPEPPPVMLAPEEFPSSEAHPEPGVPDLVADQTPHEPASAASSALFALDALLNAAELHPEPHVGDAASAPAASAPPVDTFEHEPAWSPATPDFVAAMEAREQVAPAAQQPEAAAEVAGPVFELSSEMPATVDLASDFALTSEPLLEIEGAGEQLSILDEAIDLEAGAGLDADLAPTLNFEAVPEPEPQPEPVIEFAPLPAPLPVVELDPVISAPAAAVAVPPALVDGPTVTPSAPVIAQVVQTPVPMAAVPVAPLAPQPAPTPAPWTATVAPSRGSRPAPVSPPVIAAPVKPVKSKSARSVKALEKMLRQIESRRLELASEYSPS